jgi:hypothetical protein
MNPLSTFNGRFGTNEIRVALVTALAAGGCAKLLNRIGKRKRRYPQIIPLLQIRTKALELMQHLDRQWRLRRDGEVGSAKTGLPRMAPQRNRDNAASKPGCRMDLLDRRRKGTARNRVPVETAATLRESGALQALNGKL